MGKKRGVRGRRREREGKGEVHYMCIIRSLLNTQLETLKYSVDRAGTDLDKARSESAHLTHQIKDNHRK